MIDKDAIRMRWEADGSKRDERGQRLFAASEARAAASRLWPRSRAYRASGSQRVMPRLDGLSRRFAGREETKPDAVGFGEVIGHDPTDTEISNLADAATVLVDRHYWAHGSTSCIELSWLDRRAAYPHSSRMPCSLSAGTGA